MINEKDIQTRIAELLTEEGFNVVASETQEGFEKPAVFVNVYPTSITLENASMEQVTDSIEIKYIPAVETVEECADSAQKLRMIFMYKPFEVGDRRLTLQQIEFDIEDCVLYAYFDLQYMQETPEYEEYDLIENIEIGGNI